MSARADMTMEDVAAIPLFDLLRANILGTPCLRGCRVAQGDGERPKTVRECYQACFAPGHAGAEPWDEIV